MITLLEALTLLIVASSIVTDYATGREYAPTIILLGSIVSIIYHDYTLLLILSITLPIYRMLFLSINKTYVKSGGLHYLGLYAVVIALLFSIGFILGEYYEINSLLGLDPWTSGFIVITTFYIGLSSTFTSRIKDVVFLEKIIYPRINSILGFLLLLYYALIVYAVFQSVQVYGVKSLLLLLLLPVQYWLWKKVSSGIRYLVLLLYPSTLLLILIAYWW